MKNFFVSAVIAATLALTVSPVLATDFGFKPGGAGLSQSDFKDLSKEAGAAFGYRNLAPAAPLGLFGFDIGAEISAMSIDTKSSYWNEAFNGNAPSYIGIPLVRARVGLPFGIDVGAMYSSVPKTNANLYGVELSKAILDGTLATPAIGIRGTYTKLDGLNDLDLQTYGVDASISKGFPFLTPYGGAGMLWIDSKAQGTLKTLSPSLTSENISVPRVFAGCVLTLIPFFDITVEAEYAVRPIYSLKAAFSF
jgi:hypothetical protein